MFQWLIGVAASLFCAYVGIINGLTYGFKGLLLNGIAFIIATVWGALIYASTENRNVRFSLPIVMMSTLVSTWTTFATSVCAFASSLPNPTADIWGTAALISATFTAVLTIAHAIAIKQMVSKHLQEK